MVRGMKRGEEGKRGDEGEGEVIKKVTRRYEGVILLNAKDEEGKWER